MLNILHAIGCTFILKFSEQPVLIVCHVTLNVVLCMNYLSHSAFKHLLKQEGLAVASIARDIHLSKHAKISRIHCTLWPQCTNVTDGQTDGHWHRSISTKCIYYILH